VDGFLSWDGVRDILHASFFKYSCLPVIMG